MPSFVQARPVHSARAAGSLLAEEADEARPRAGHDGDVFSNLLAQRLGDDARVDLVYRDRHLSF